MDNGKQWQKCLMKRKNLAKDSLEEDILYDTNNTALFTIKLKR